MKTLKLATTLFFAALSVASSFAGMNKNPNKFLGNITTGGYEQCDISGYKFSDYWEQVTCENGCKWGSIHKGWGKFDWGNADRTYQYCKQNGLIFKFHAMIWGSQYPGWIKGLSVADTKKAIIEWYDAVAKHFPDLQIMDVVNEAIYSGGNYHSPYKDTNIIEALGELANERNHANYGCNKNGYPNTNSYQWIAEAFRLARERWPHAILIYNDYNTFQWQKTEFINLVNGLKACNAPIDAAGCQSHDLNDMGGAQFKNALYEIHDKIKLPIYITEYDIAKSDDQVFYTRYSEQFPVMWEADFVPGVTLWGWQYGSTWVNGSGLIRNGQKRSAMTWLENYMKTDAAKNAKAPTMGGPSVNGAVKLSKESVELGESVKITVAASATEGVDHVDIYANNKLLVNKYMTPYEFEFTPEETGTVTVKITVFDKKGNKSDATASVLVCDARKPFNGSAIELPGTIEAEDFDKGCPGISFFDSDDKNEGAAEAGADDYRQDGSGVDVVKLGNGGHAIGYTAAKEWLEYTVYVKEAGNYSYEATVSSGSDAAKFHLSSGQYDLTSTISIPQGADWDTYTTVKGNLSRRLEAGEQIIRLTFDGAYGNVDKIKFTCNDCNSSTTGIENLENIFGAGEYAIFNMNGEYLGKMKVEAGEYINDVIKQSVRANGPYILRNLNTEVSKVFICR